MNNVRFIQHLDGVNTFGGLFFASKKHFSITRNRAYDTTKSRVNTVQFVNDAHMVNLPKCTTTDGLQHTKILDFGTFEICCHFEMVKFFYFCRVTSTWGFGFHSNLNLLISQRLQRMSRRQTPVSPKRFVSEFQTPSAIPGGKKTGIDGAATHILHLHQNTGKNLNNKNLWLITIDCSSLTIVILAYG